MIHIIVVYEGGNLVIAPVHKPPVVHTTRYCFRIPVMGPGRLDFQLGAVMAAAVDELRT